MSSVTYSQAMNPTSWGYQPGNFSTANMQATFTDLDVSDRVAIGGRSLIGAIATSIGLSSAAKTATTQIAVESAKAQAHLATLQMAELAQTGVRLSAAKLAQEGLQLAATSQAAGGTAVVQAAEQSIAAAGRVATSASGTAVSGTSSAMQSATKAVEQASRTPTAGALFKNSIGANLRRSLLIGGLISVGTNFYKALTGQQTGVQAAGNVVADSVSTVGGTVAATAAAGAVAAAMGAAPGILMAGATFLVGTAAFVGVDALLKVSGIHGGIAEGASNLIQKILDRFKGNTAPGGV